MGGLKCLWLSCNLSFISRVWFIFNEAFKSLCRRWVVWFDPWLAPLQDCFLLKHWRVGGAYGETLGTDCLTVWDSQTDEECHVWAEFTKCLRGRRGERRGKKKKYKNWRSHLPFLPWSRLPPTPSLEMLPQIPFTHSSLNQPAEEERLWLAFKHGATTKALNNSSLAFSTRRIGGKVGNHSTNGQVLFKCWQQGLQHSSGHVMDCYCTLWFIHNCV